MSDRPALLDHPPDKEATAIKVQTGVSVGHEDLLVAVKTSDISTKPGGPPIHKHRHVTNVPAGYS
jgi:hypothetical protein